MDVNLADMSLQELGDAFTALDRKDEASLMYALDIARITGTETSLRLLVLRWQDAVRAMVGYPGMNGDNNLA